MLDKYAFGLTWIATASKKEFYRDNLGQTGFYQGSSKRTAITHSKENISKISVAAILADQFENLLLITDKLDFKDKNGKPLYWLCMIERGAVVISGTLLSHQEATDALLANGSIAQESQMDINISGDEILSHDALSAALPYLGHRIKGSTKSYTVCLDIEDESLINLCGLIDVAEIQVLNLFDLLSQEHPTWRRYSIVVIKKPKLKYVVIAAIIVVSALWYGYSYYKDHLDQTARERVLQQQQLERQRIQAENLKRQHDLFIKNIQSKNAFYVLSNFLNAVNRMPYYNHGWQMSGVQFDAEQTSELVVTYQRMHYANMKDLILLKDTISATQMELAKNTDSAALTVKFDYLSQKRAYNITLTDFKDKKGRFNALASLISALQDSHLVYALDKTVSDNTGNHIQMLSVSGEGITAFRQLIEATANNAYLTIKAFTVVFDHGQIRKWQFKGSMYE
ncbi:MULTISPECIES: type 4b pilus protein PilO2 [Cysteiniphilum]|uniref:Pilin accessory protein (PilO) n=1 Tax=Cysteiniphilum litorale TaxID=2056700 RepID=A0A8J2Z371_9GAMM|nr:MULTISPECIES: type 4b pilus protein PilO2 [Cysteiniphilum]GGF92716.1 hypothetical protein GCM10010995_07350 [Cysteiniphilum litorale]